MNSALIRFTLICCIFSAHIASAQITDNFSDGNFDQNPAWTGDVANFKVNASGELQLNATAPGQSGLFVAGNIPDSTVWDFEVRLAFDPSGQNLVRIYLQTDQTDLSLANGYYLEMGETGSADAIRFFRQDGASKTQLAIGQAGLAGSSPNLHIHVKRTISGDWQVEAGTVGSALQVQFTLQESTWPGGANRFFGVQCVYTISNATKFFFDNIDIHPDVPDTQAPVLVSAQADSINQVTLVFNEDLENGPAETPSNYSINQSIGQPVSATLSPDKRTVVLKLQNTLNTGTYTLQASNIKDINGNNAIAQTIDFQYVKIDAATEFDILINEIMADPSPSVGLPELEWVEIYHRSNKVINLGALRFSDATSTPVALPTYQIQPGEYVGLCAFASASALQAVTSGKVLGAGISSTMLNNDSDVLTLSDASGNVIDKVAYSILWHDNPDKKDGGYSLERVNPTLPCLGGENWRSSLALVGATLAARNSVYADDPDLEQPHLFKAFTESSTSILLTFTEGMDALTAENPAAYKLSPPITIASADQLTTDLAQVRLTLSSPLQPSVLYTLNVETSVEDCSGNPFMFIDTVLLGLAEKPDIQDIVINEILFNPATGGARYVEFYNRSNKIFDWSQFFLASVSDSTNSVVQIQQDRLFLPGEYHVFSNDATDTRERYANIVLKNVMQNTLPSLDDISDSIKIYWAGNGQTLTVDSFYYRRTMHNALLSTTEQEGVSLERLRADGPTQDPSNWTSASPLKTGAPGTPTLPNSQALPDVPELDDLISIPLARLSPDGDSYEDFLEIYYHLPREGYAASLTIFDSDGNIVKTLVRHDLIGTEGAVHWDGDTDKGTKARPGIHVLYFEIFSPTGELRRMKKAVAVVGKY